MVSGGFADRSVGERDYTRVDAGQVGQRAAERVCEKPMGLAIELERTGLAGRTNHSPCGRREANQLACLAAVCAGGELRRKAGRQQELHPKRDLECVGRVLRMIVKQRQSATKQVEDLRVRLSRIKDAAQRIAGARGAIERALVSAKCCVGTDRFGARDGHQVAAPFVQLKVEPEERLKASAEAAFGSPYALCNCAQLAAHRRVHVEDPIGLAVTDRTQHDGFRLDRAGHQVVLRGRATFIAMPNVVMYSSTPCPFCTQAKALLNAREIPFEEINLTKDAEGRVALNEKTGMMTFPQILIDGELIGGFQELIAADQSGKLDELLAAS